MFKYIGALLCALNIAAFGMDFKEDSDCAGSASSDTSSTYSSSYSSEGDSNSSSASRSTSRSRSSSSSSYYLSEADSENLHDDAMAQALVLGESPYQENSIASRLATLDIIQPDRITPQTLEYLMYQSIERDERAVFNILKSKVLPNTQAYRSRSPFFISIGRLRKAESSDVLAEHDAIWSAQKVKIASQKGDTE